MKVGEEEGGGAERKGGFGGRVVEVSDLQSNTRQGNGQVIHLTVPESATGVRPYNGSRRRGQPDQLAISIWCCHASLVRDSGQTPGLHSMECRLKPCISRLVRISFAWRSALIVL